MTEERAAHTVLVDARWVAKHRADPAVRLVDVGDDESHAEGHLPGAVAWDWDREILGGFRLQPIAAATMEALLARSGITSETTVVLTGVWPTLSFWLLKLFGHADVRILDGGREAWVAGGGSLDAAPVEPVRTVYGLSQPDLGIRATHDQVLERLGRTGTTIVDARTIEEYRGEHLWPGSPPGYCQRAGHIPGAKHLAWNTTTNVDGTFRPVDELRSLVGETGIEPGAEVIPYCTIGGRSSHVWFVLTQLLGYPHVRLYDGSWLEWSHLVDAPIEC